MASHFELKKTTNGQFTFKLTAANGEIILTSETCRELTDDDRRRLNGGVERVVAKAVGGRRRWR